MSRVLFILTSKKSFYIAFLLTYLISIAWLLFSDTSSALLYMSFNQALLIRVGAFLIYLMFSYLSVRNIKFATWIMVLVLLYTGLGNTALGLFRVGWDQFILKPYFIIFGIYFIFGAVTLIYYATKRRKRF